MSLPPTLQDRLAKIVGPNRVLARNSQLLAYSSDALPGYTKVPSLAVFPGSRDEAIAVVKELAKDDVPFVPRGAGTGLSGGALAEGVVLLGMNRLKRIIAVDVVNQLAVVEPGVVNSVLSREIAQHGLHYAPDPSSQAACTIGGNVAENAGGPHCLKYGATLNHVVAVTAVLPNGDVHTFGNAAGENTGYDLVGAFVGSEGCFGVTLDVTVRLTRNPPAIRTLLADFMTIDAAARSVSAIIAKGILPAALEMMDAGTIRAVEESIYAAGYPVDAAAVVLIELDGLAEGIDEDAETVVSLCRSAGARTVRVATDDAERARLWQGRKKAFGAMGRASADLVVQDAVVPRTALPDVLEAIAEIAARHRVRVSNVFHAGDGNLHPNLSFDASDPDQLARVEAASGEIMRACVAAGGSITGEHGVGLDKLRYMGLIFTPDDMAAMAAVRSAFDPAGLANPGKVIPTAQCNEWKPWGHPAHHAPRTTH